MNYEYKNAKQREDGLITCEHNHPKLGWVIYTADPNDVEEYGRRLYQAIVDNGDYELYTPPPPPTEDELALSARNERNRLLRTYVDPIVTNPLRWADLPEDLKQQVIDYRQALLDVPEQPGFPTDIVWPTPPMQP